MSVIVIYIAHAEQVTPETRRATIRIQLWRPIGLIISYAQCAYGSHLETSRSG